MCLNCGQSVAASALGTRHRNHCPYCLWSKHLDHRPGDRQAACGGGMAPVGLTFKAAREGKIGEMMVVHMCQPCGVIRKNRIAGDDQEEMILKIYHDSLSVKAEVAAKLAETGVAILNETDEKEVLSQLFGKPNLPTKFQ